MFQYNLHPDLRNAISEQLIGNHRNLFQRGFILSVNEKGSQVVKSVTLEEDSHPLVMKRYIETGFGQGFRTVLGLSRAQNAFNGSVMLSRLGVRTPRHLFLGKHASFNGAENYLVMEKSLGKSLHKLIYAGRESSPSLQVLEGLAKAVNVMHLSGVSHGDLHAGNIYVLPNNEVEFIDLDNVRRRRRGLERDRMRLLNCFQTRPRLQKKIAQLLKSVEAS